MATSFFNGAFFNGEFFNTGGTPPVVAAATLAPAGRSSRGRKRKVLVGDRMYEVDSLKDVEFLLKRVVRDDPEPVAKAAKARIRVVDRVSAKLEAVEPVALPVAAEVDWSSLWVQLAMQDRAYAEALERVMRNMEEDDIEAVLWLH